MKMTLEQWMKLQCEEIEKFIWCEGVRLGHDPTLDKTRDEWALIWIQCHAEKMRKEAEDVKD